MYPPSLEALLNRLVARGTETEQTLGRRLRNAQSEITESLDEEANLIHFRLLNDDKETAIKEFIATVEGLYEAELK